MALKQGGEHYTMFKFAENGNVMNRRVHRIEFQDRTGKVHILEGNAMPELITLSTGTAQKGCHIATILLKPESAPANSSEGGLWPSKRDVLHGFAGIVVLVLLQHFVQLARMTP